MEKQADYDEFSLLRENADEFGLPFDPPPTVDRRSVELSDGRALSALVWGQQPAELVFLHGGGQNAHTWDTVALALRRPLVAIDLPGHGHSDDAADDANLLSSYAGDVASAIERLAPDARAIVGMSAGGLTAIALSGIAPRQLRKLVLVDILPNPNPAAARLIADFLNGPETFDSLDELLSRTIAFNPTRSPASLRRGILHNTVRLPDGRWKWRHQRRAKPSARSSPVEAAQQSAHLWRLLDEIAVPMMLVRGLERGSVITDEQETEFRRRRPDARIERVSGAGHSVQGDRPLVLAQLIDEFVR